MYRINLHPEFAENRRSARQAAARTAFAVGLLGGEAILLVSFVVSGILLREQASTLRAALPRLRAQVSVGEAPNPDVDLARMILQTRRERIDWSPKLAALSERLPPSLILREVRGETETRRSPGRCRIEGQIRSSGAGLEAVTVFLERLRLDSRFSADFPRIELGRIRGTESDEFEIACETAGKATR
jgi:hypothetical protein